MINKLITSIALIAFMVITSCNSPRKVSQNAVLLTTDTTIKDDRFHFFVFGDWGRRGKQHQQEVADQMIAQSKKLNAQFLITVGDNFYDDGVQSVTDSHWAESYTNVYKDLATKTDWYITLGNHDYRGKPEAQLAYHSINPKWNLPARYYSKVVTTADGQKVLLVFIDTNPFIKGYYAKDNMPEIKTQDTAAQRVWIEKTLAQSKEPWKFVIGHHPVYSSSPKHGNTIELVEMLKPMLDKYHVQAYIAGHDHDLQHNQPTASKVDYFISGAASEIRDADAYEKTKFSASVPGFVDMSIKGDSLFVNFIDNNGKVIYHYNRTK